MNVSSNLNLSGAAWRGIASIRAEEARANSWAGKTLLAGSVEETPLQKNLRQMKDNLERLRTTASPKQQAASRVSWLKRRLEIMLASLQFATPEQAKAMARELKKIAKELASAAKNLNGGEGANSTGAVRPAVGNITLTGAHAADNAIDPSDAATVADTAQAAQSAQQAEAQADQAAQQAAAVARTAENEAATATVRSAATEKMSEGGKIGETRSAPGSGASDANDKSLRTQLEEASRLLKWVLALLKSRLTDKESKKDVAAAETNLVQVERALSQTSGLYDALGASPPIAVPTGGVDTSA